MVVADVTGGDTGAIEEALAAAAWALQRHGKHPGSSSDIEKGWTPDRFERGDEFGPRT